MSANRNAWSAAERDEFETLCEESWDSSVDQTERTNAFLAGLHDAEQAQRIWARDELARIEHKGAGAVLKAWRKAQASIMLTHDGRIYTKARTVGVRRRNESGDVWHQQELFELLDIDELRARGRESAAIEQSWGALTAMYYGLVALCEMAEVRTPREAELKLGITCDQWLERATA